MGRANPIFNAFTQGELSPKVDGRTDIKSYYQGCRELRNMVVYPHGGATKRPGFLFVAGAKYNNKKSILIPFQYNALQAYMIEAGDQYLRFFMDGGQILSGGNPYELATTYLEADLALLRWAQSADTVYIVHSGYPPRKLTRSGHTSWAINTVDFVWGPFKDQNVSATTMAASALTGNITITASASFFVAGHNGAQIKLIGDIVALSSIAAANTFTSAITINKGEVLQVSISGTWVATVMLQRSYDGGSNWYDYFSWTTNQTLEITGIEDNVQFRLGIKTAMYTSGTAVCRLCHPNVAGYAKITAYTSATQVSATVVQPLAMTTATTKWAIGAWCTAYGYPRNVAFHEQRLIFADNADQPGAWWASVIDDYENFKSGVLDGDAFSYTIASNRVNLVSWLVSQDKLMVGTFGDEFRIGTPTDKGFLTPTNPDVKRQTSYGSDPHMPVMVGDSILFLQRLGHKLRAVRYDYTRDHYGATDISRKSDHILRAGGVQIVYADQPDPTAWIRMADGTFTSCTYEPDQEVIAFATQLTLGAVESMGVITGDGRDELWALINRTINGATKRYVEQLSTLDWEYVEECVFSDAAVTFYNPAIIEGATKANPVVISSTAHPFLNDDIIQVVSVLGMTQINDLRFVVKNKTADSFELYTLQGDPVDGTGYGTFTGEGVAEQVVNTVSGLTHLAGEEVAILTDGGEHERSTVSAGGVLNLDWGARFITVGLPYTAVLKTMRIEAGAEGGTAQAKRKKIFKAAVRLLDSVGLMIGPSEFEVDNVPFRTPSMPMDNPIDPFTGDMTVTFPGGIDSDGYITLVHDFPLPFSVTAIMPEVYTSDTAK